MRLEWRGAETQHCLRRGPNGHSLRARLVRGRRSIPAADFGTSSLGDLYRPAIRGSEYDKLLNLKSRGEPKVETCGAGGRERHWAIGRA